MAGLNATINTVEMHGQGGGSDTGLWITLGYGFSTDEIGVPIDLPPLLNRPDEWRSNCIDLTQWRKPCL